MCFIDMNIVNRNIGIEEYLTRSAISLDILTDVQYKKTVEEWMKIYKEPLVHGYPEYYGYVSGGSLDALNLLLNKCPFDGYVFNVSRFQNLEGTFTHGNTTFAYYFESLKFVDSVLLNEEGVCICDVGMQFMALFNEMAAFHPSLYLEVSS